jgi:hypothetical protein
MRGTFLRTQRHEAREQAATAVIVCGCTRRAVRRHDPPGPASQALRGRGGEGASDHSRNRLRTRQAWS